MRPVDVILAELVENDKRIEANMRRRSELMVEAYKAGASGYAIAKARGVRDNVIVKQLRALGVWKTGGR